MGDGRWVDELKTAPVIGHALTRQISQKPTTRRVMANWKYAAVGQNDGENAAAASNQLRANEKKPKTLYLIAGVVLVCLLAIIMMKSGPPATAAPASIESASGDYPPYQATYERPSFVPAPSYAPAPSYTPAPTYSKPATPSHVDNGASLSEQCSTQRGA